MRTTHAASILHLAKQRPYFKVKDAEQVGASRVVLTRLVREGQIKRVIRGLYRDAHAPTSEHEELLKVAHQIEQGVFCLFSALRLFGIKTPLFHGVWLAVPPQYKPPRITSSKLHFARLSRPAFSAGIETHTVNGLQIRVYGVAKTVADCFRLHDKIGFPVALETLRQAWINNLLDMEELLHYAGILQVEEVMHPYLESLIWHRRNGTSRAS